MLSVSTMALAAMIGSACVPNANQACNVNSCTYDQAKCAANGGQDLNCLLNGLGACLQDGCQNGNVRPAGVSGLGSCRR